MKKNQKKNNKNYTLKALLDSTYLLPAFGIEVQGLTDKDLEMIREVAAQGKVQLYCLTISWIEILGKVAREAYKKGINVEKQANVAIKSLTRTRLLHWIQPPPNALLLALKLRLQGHRDMIDNTLYATASVNHMFFVTMDSTLKKFLKKQGFNTELLLTHNQLLEKAC